MAVLAAALVLSPPALLFLLPQMGPAFAVDGKFDEWTQTEGVHDSSADGALPPGVDLTEVRMHAGGRELFVYARTSGPLFGAPEESIVRAFVDADADSSTGFSMGDFGADLMVEAAGEGGRLAASGLFAFSPERGPDDWNGWMSLGALPIAVSGTQLETVLPSIGDASRARVLVAISARGGGQDLLDAPASPAGSLVIDQTAPDENTVASGTTDATSLSLRFLSAGTDAKVGSLTLAPSGGADFRVIASARLVLDGRPPSRAQSLSGGAVLFAIDPPLQLVHDVPLAGAVIFDFDGGGAFDEASGKSFGATVSTVAYAPSQAALSLHPRIVAPTTYLRFISPSPAIDGAFGEWRLATAQPDAPDATAPRGGDLLGTRALWSEGAGGFYAEARGELFEGAPIAGLPRRVVVPAASSALGSAITPPLPASPAPELPPFTADDRLFVFLDTDNDPRTGFAPFPGAPVGAEFVIQVAGRFGEAQSAHLLEFTGRWPAESAWVPRETLKAASSGPSVEGELPALIAARGSAVRLLFETVAWSGRTADLSDAVQEVRFGPVVADHFLHFRSVVFDPLLGPPAVRSDLLVGDPTGYWVIQLNSAPTTAVTESLERAGATLYGYVHSNAYLARMDVGVEGDIRAMAEVRWVGIYQPAFKFVSDPSAWGDAPLDLLAILFEHPEGLEAEVAAQGGAVLSASDRALRVRIDGQQAERLSFIPEIQFLQPENRRAPLNDVGRRLQGVNLTFDHLGLDGAGIVVGISDSGIDFTHTAFDDTGNATTGPHFDGRIVGYYRYGGAYGDSDGHGTHTAGSIAGDGDLSSTVNNSVAGGAVQFRGMAPAASLVVAEIFGTSPPGDDGVFADQQAFGATVSSNSWGYVNQQQLPITDYETSAYLTDKSVIDSNASRSGLQPMTIVFAAGNAGAGADTVGSPGTAKNVITVGASETDRGYDTYSDNVSSIAGFSSRGPTDDGRVKPDVVAVGTYVLSTQSRTSGCTCTYGGWDLSWTGSNYAFSSGTSQATPQVSGIVALIQQSINDTYGRIPSPALVKAALINGAQDLGYGYEYTTGVTGPMSQGWGRVNVSRSIEGPPDGRILYFEEGQTLGSGDVAVRQVVVASSGVPLKVTLVWTDMPGNPADTATLAELVNDLDLVVRAPNGTYYHGNKFGGAWSRANNTSFDRLNNVENVFVNAPSAGTWSIEVTGYSIKSAQQKFAMAVSGNLTEKAPPSVAESHTVPGVPAGAKFGWNLTAAGSINGDAFADLVVGAPGANGGNGSVYVFLGGALANASSLDVSMANVTLNGTAAEAFGSSLDSAGDFNGDGVNDLLIGAPGGGKVYLFFGSSNWTARTSNVTFVGAASDQFGSAVALAGPLDNRSGAEAIVGAPANNSSRGAVFVFSGGAGGASTRNTSVANATLVGNASAWRMGTSVSAGDLDGDGYLDLGAGAPGASVVRVARGGVAPASLAFNATIKGIPGSAFGQSLALSGDLNGDGKKDVLVGAPLANGSAGAAYVFFGRSPLADDQVIRYYFFDDMESGVAQWDEMSGSSIAASPWSLSTSVYFGDGASGNSWQDSSGNYASNADASIRFHNPLNLSGATDPVLAFVYKADLETIATKRDGFLVAYSTNNGTSWTQLDSSNTQGNYDGVGTAGSSPIAGNYAFTYDRFVWRKVTFNISSLVGQSSVVFRFQFGSGNSGEADGVYIDNVEVRESHPSSPNFTASGEGSGDLFGWYVAAVGDVDLDGVGDFAAGAPMADAGLTLDAGAAYLFTGSDALNGSTTALSADEVLRSASASSSLGWSLAGLTGFNSTNSTYLVAGAPTAEGGAGTAGFGDATAPIPEFADMAVAVLAAAAIVMVSGRRRRRAPTA